MGLGTTTLLAPQPSESPRRAQLVAFHSPSLRCRECLEKGFLTCFAFIQTEERDASKTIEFRLPGLLPHLLLYLHSLFQRPKRRFVLAPTRERLGQKSESIRSALPLAWVGTQTFSQAD